MTPAQLADVPDSLLIPGTHRIDRLLRYLSQRGLRLSLLDLEQERVRRGMRPAPTTPTKGTQP